MLVDIVVVDELKELDDVEIKVLMVEFKVDLNVYFLIILFLVKMCMLVEIIVFNCVNEVCEMLFFG